MNQKSTCRIEPREWQVAAMDRIKSMASKGADSALICGCPGSGKTHGSLFIAKMLSQLLSTNKLVVLTPSNSIKTQWIDRAAELGIVLEELDDVRDLHQVSLFNADVIHGYVINYQQVSSVDKSLKRFCEIARPIVILDEVHHVVGSTKKRSGSGWGTAVEYACPAAAFKLCLTGTPWREKDCEPIVFVTYDSAGKVASDFSYTYGNAIRNKDCRPIEFEFYDGYIRWATNGGAEHGASFEDKLSKRAQRKRLEAALSTDGSFPLPMLEAAHAKLMELRSRGGADADAGGIVTCSDVPHALAVAEVMREHLSVDPVVVYGETDKYPKVDAERRIQTFRDGDAPWIVGVKMLAEGVDLPRLRVGVYMSTCRTALFFHQFCGRLVRVQDRERDERSYVYVPRDPEIEAIALEIEEERAYALGEEIPQRQITGNGEVRRGPKPQLRVLESESEAVSNVLSGKRFPREYLDEHSAVIRAFRLKSDEYKEWSDSKVASVLIDSERLDPPGDARA